MTSDLTDFAHQLAMRPTPIEPWLIPGLADDFVLHIKRDDLTGCTLSGNKVRKLEFILAEALAGGYDSVITCGGIQSNHCRATAVAAAQLGLSSHLVLRSDREAIDEKDRAGNLLIGSIVGAAIALAPKGPYLTTLKPRMDRIAAEHEASTGGKMFHIPVGGSTPLGAWGYIDAFAELLGQGLTDRFDDIVLACGSGGTVCGLAVANYLCGSPVRVHGITVCDNADYFYAHIDETLAALGLSSETSARDIVSIVDGHKGVGYALSTPEELQFIRDVAQGTGILLDPVYTGKAAFGLGKELTARPQQFKGRRILFVHTGGAFGALDGRLA